MENFIHRIVAGAPLGQSDAPSDWYSGQLSVTDESMGTSELLRKPAQEQCDWLDLTLIV